jgi:nucleotide-binding universal stress UspA family protein
LPLADQPLKILVAYDGSERSRKALEWPTRFVHPEVTVISVVQTLSGSEPIADAVDPANIRLANQQNLQEVVAAALGEHGIAPKLINAAGNPAEEIIRAAERGAFDLVILGAQGMNAIERFLLGSVSARVARYAPCPVLVVR